jgi:ribosomal protein L11 methyltransferase
VEAWQATLKPMPIGRRLLALPESLEPPARTRRIVVRVPLGQAFGTGEHATTRLCLRLLEARLKRGDRVADLGTGTGILAVAALRLGASRVVAVDVDPVAVRVARDTLQRNGANGRIDLRCADAAEACRRGPFDLALVNIGATALERLLPDIATALRPGGLAVLAGHLVEDEAGLLAVARRSGLRPAKRLRARPWSALLLRRA